MQSLFTRRPAPAYDRTGMGREFGSSHGLHCAPRRGARWSAVLLVLLGTAPARAQRVPDSFTVETLAPGLSAPVAFDFLPDGRVLFAEQLSASVRLFKEGSGVQAAPVLSVPGVAIDGGERGLLGLALDPEFPRRPYLYLYYDVASPHHIRIARYKLAGDLAGTSAGDVSADPTSRYDLIDDIPDQTAEHNGGTLRFGVEGALYASVGDDGAPCAAQDSISLRGVIVRLLTRTLPAGPGSAFRAQVTPLDNPFAAAADSNLRLVAALGLRNPFRFQVDPVSGTLVIADVGESQREELDLLQAPVVSSSGPLPAAARLGADFGWPYHEGIAPGAHRADCGIEPIGLSAPVFDYDRTQQNGAAIISAGVYRSFAGRVHQWPAGYDGDLFASDYYSGVLRRITHAARGWVIAPPVPGQPSAETWADGFTEVSDWRLGPDGALWFCRQSVGFAANTGSIGRISGPGGPPPPDSLPRISVEVWGSPAVGGAELRMTLKVAGPARLFIHDASGRMLRSWRDTEFVRFPTRFGVSWDGRDADGHAVRPGIYLARLEANGQTDTVTFPFLR